MQANKNTLVYYSDSCDSTSSIFVTIHLYATKYWGDPKALGINWIKWKLCSKITFIQTIFVEKKRNFVKKFRIWAKKRRTL